MGYRRYGTRDRSYTVHAELMNHTADELRQMARDARQRSADSWERSDTDGFLSQWAADSMADLYDMAARLAEADWTGEEFALFTLDGELLDARYVETPYGWSWVYDGPHGPVWVTESQARDWVVRRRNNERKGYRIGRVKVAAVPITTSGSGFSVTNTWKRDAKRPEVTEVITADFYGDQIAAGRTSR